MNTTFLRRWGLDMIEMDNISGIDVSKHNSIVVILIDGQPFKEFKIANDRSGYQVLDDGALVYIRSHRVIS